MLPCYHGKLTSRILPFCNPARPYGRFQPPLFLRFLIGVTLGLCTVINTRIGLYCTSAVIWKKGKFLNYHLCSSIDQFMLYTNLKFFKGSFYTVVTLSDKYKSLPTSLEPSKISWRFQHIFVSFALEKVFKETIKKRAQLKFSKFIRIHFKQKQKEYSVLSL